METDRDNRRHIYDELAIASARIGYRGSDDLGDDVDMGE